jgi:lipopolysaccharide/colanic/teichoic acid biosynthesis glycosyltransferase
MRRSLDILVAALGLFVLSPLFAGLALWVALDSRGPVLYRARRIGLHGTQFSLYKFRSMVADADRQGPGITIAQDQRITRAGRFLRRSKLDELPQLINVLDGSMSLVGPRPEDPRYVALYTAEQRRILDVKPGITSAASLTYRNEQELLTGVDWETQYRNEIMPAKIAIDLAYEEKRTVGSDLQLIARTVLAMFD